VLPQTVIGFDYGSRRIGVAVGQGITGQSNPIVTLVRQKDHPDWSAINQLMEEWQPQAIVVGMPLNKDGTAHHLTKAVQRFGNQLHERYNLPVHMIDERLSSHEAKKMLSKRQSSSDKGAIDKYAAKLILDSWFQQQALLQNK
jgi:putative Holliday junction resolvase